VNPAVGGVVLGSDPAFTQWLQQQSPGRGTPDELGEALGLYRDLARENEADAQERVGYMLMAGHGARQDRYEGFLWILQAAREGQPSAQYSIGNLYLSGYAFAVNQDAGECWLRKAASSDPRAAQALDKLSVPRQELPECDFPPYEAPGSR
jgi:uncharacterized protein